MRGERIVAGEKITGYLLDEKHPRGASKARFFVLFGFDPANPIELEDALRAHPTDNDVVTVTQTAFGIRSVVECNLIAPDGRNPCIRSVWLRENGSDVHRLVTAYPSGASRP